MGNWKVLAPKSATNYVTNPSFETGTTGWAVGGAGGGTVTQSTTYRHFGAYSLRCAGNNGAGATTVASYTVTLPSAGTYTFSTYMFWDDSGAGTAVSLDVANFSPISKSQTGAHTTTSGNQWVRLSMSLTVSSDLTGDIIVTITSPTTDDEVFLDGVMLADAADITYIDGDQAGCAWTGTAHASSSQRDALSRAGGTIIDLEDDLSFYVERLIGAGAPPVENVTQRRALLSGSAFQRTLTRERRFSMTGTVIGTTLANLHSKRQDLIKYFSPDYVPNQEALTILYQPGLIGNSVVDKQIRARYVGGLELDQGNAYADRVALVLQADENPYWEGISQDGQVLSTLNSITTRYVAGKESGVWGALGLTANPTTNGTVYATAFDSTGKLYVGGDFQGFDGNAGWDYLVSYDTATDTWAQVAASGDLDGAVYAMAVDASDNVYVGGAFTTTTAGDYFARWNGSSWDALADATTGAASITAVYTLAIATDPADSDTTAVYIGGDFDNWGDVAAADNLVLYDIADDVYRALPVTPNNVVRAIAYNNPSAYRYGQLLIGGDFTSLACDVGTASYLFGYLLKASQTTYAITDSGGSALTARVRAIIHDGYFYVGGDFTDLSSNYVGRTASIVHDLEAVGSGFDAAIYSLAVDSSGNIYAGGGDISQGTSYSGGDFLSVYKGGAWQNADILLPASSVIQTISTRSSEVFVGFDQTGTATSGDSTSFTPEGTARGYPIITIKRSGGTGAQLYNIKNDTTGAELVFDYLLADGETLTVDLRPGQRSVTSSISGAIWPFLEGTNLTDWYLLPNASNTISVFVNPGGGPTITSLLWYNPRFWSLD